MKCVKSNRTGQVIRVQDLKAAELVKSGAFKYADKDSWKKGGRLREMPPADK